ncbi:hypothetical protein EVAR_83927_1 [Eumeta japonica]|uniref:Uncharacterized protein n=1 Tax=Eumeta variegata TaxID=151549 RepID=A0A4C1XV97_EUMVA|nr:hypothetical protein EVAR_83927_1 [Eumeta japonica]
MSLKKFIEWYLLQQSVRAQWTRRSPSRQKALGWNPDHNAQAAPNPDGLMAEYRKKTDGIRRIGGRGAPAPAQPRRRY